MSFTWDSPYPSFRLPVFGQSMVATTQPLAAQAGLAALRVGGNAVDAALATAITLTVVEPVMNGLGGDLFAIVSDQTGLHGLNASGPSPAGWTRERFAGQTAMPISGVDSVTVPGQVAGWRALHDRFGRLPFADLFEPAIRYARDGFPVSAYVSRLWAQQIGWFGAEPTFRDAFTIAGRAPAPGEMFRLPDQSRTLANIAESGGDSFYSGNLARQIAAFMVERGGLLNERDLAAHRCDWVKPLNQRYAGFDVHELPPNGQGIAALLALGILEKTEQPTLPPDDPLSIHLQIEAMREAFRLTDAHVGDAAHMAVSSVELLDPASLQRIADRIMRERATPGPTLVPAGSGTVYLAVGDASGMMVSLIQSNYRGFGSGLVVPGTGISLHSRGSGFVLTPNHPNEVGSSKRPLNTIIPGFVTKDGAPVAAFGVMGGVIQPQGHVQLMSRMLASGQNPQAAIDAPRWRYERDGTIRLETGVSDAVRDGLRTRGHRLGSVEPWSYETGAGQVIWHLGDCYVGATESRRDGVVATC
jgi:gamma-glutamyltranspeptidase / glutathione hydrolase